ncbi:MAG: tetratricopeptide repeat protein [Duodenibacillus sp.]
MLTDSEVRRLLDIANAGVQKGLVSQARRVYEGILANRPAHVPTLISLAMSQMAVGEYSDAEATLRDKVLAEHPEDDDALAYLGLNAFLAGRPDEARDILVKVTPDSTAGTMAQNLLEKING